MLVTHPCMACPTQNRAFQLAPQPTIWQLSGIFWFDSYDYYLE